MKRIAIIAVTGLLALVLTACGQNGSNKPTAGTTNNPAPQQGQNPAPAGGNQQNTTAPQQ